MMSICLSDHHTFLNIVHAEPLVVNRGFLVYINPANIVMIASLLNMAGASTIKPGKFSSI
jgi:hypothetical protein